MPAILESSSEAYVSVAVPEGGDPPADFPREIFQAALGVFLSRRRLDMRALAKELGVSRGTLYRRAGARDGVLSHVIWFLTRRLMIQAAEQTSGLDGIERVIAVISRFLSDVQDQPALRRFLEAEPEAALRVLTSKQGQIQQGMIDAVDRLLEHAEHTSDFRSPLERDTLAYAIVRIGESFIYADVIADNPPQVDRGVAVIERLLVDR